MLSVESRNLESFEIHGVQDASFPSFQEPKELGTFSIDGQRTFCNNASNLKFYKQPSSQIHFDLSAGHRQAIRKDYGKNEKLDSMLYWILANRYKVISSAPENNKVLSLSVDFVCFRGLLTLLVCTPYENKEDWIIVATKYHGTIYLCAFDTESGIRRRQTMNERDDLMSYWGFKFEQYVTADSPEHPPNSLKPVNENEEFCTMCKTRLNSKRILYGAEIDCIDPTMRQMCSTKRYIELKTSREITSARQDRNFRRYKLLKWWAQSFLIGIPKIVCGVRDDDGYVLHLKTYETGQIPKMAKELWDPCRCFNFCDQFLDYVKKCAVKDNPFIIYKFDWGPGRNIQCQELEATRDFQILPEWYISQIF